ncbi:hypothetical protein CR5_133 [Cronobacter phage CR5]|uniref:Uncharacterized protein n=1 Tax=Salmonella muenchen TaxID=596 RepID=A0A5U8XKE4_SALMU|nr:hypothetical protein CR5_133 [Cronobacter phage CR5]EBS0563284.1 hypothetical protein [Salmonella enterica subsp. enterica serovar Muenchen]EBZ2963285.1 hypothetical protein [Salmonella enterica subsp. enterica serovar Enteritidis]ECG1798599.1 hypothetical protein [Salmonella enterica subsp. enterica serovar Paratyphi B]ECG3269066.1 hypothetical protein [Salmonella enterica subsp. enterica serovar Infantis]EIP7032404.1 hypothetical protein [Salmonella enterica]
MVDGRLLLNDIMLGKKIEDTHENADALLQMFIPLTSEHYEILPIGVEYIFRSRDKKYEAARYPRTLGGLILLQAQFEGALARILVYYATGGQGF